METVDYHGHPRSAGGDPIAAQLTVTDDKSLPSQSIPMEIQIQDLENGMYKVIFRPVKAGRYSLKISVFERPIKDYPLFFDVTEHNEPIKVYGVRGSERDEFHQPVAIAIDDIGNVYVVDTGNSRIKASNLIVFRLIFWIKNL